MKHKIWYGFSGEPYSGKEQAFFNADDYAWAKYMEANWEIIRDEIKVLFDDEENKLLKPYFENRIQYPPSNWKTESFSHWGKKNHRMCKLFPKTSAILDKVPGLLGASINLLEPGSKILPHFGDTNAIFRCHMGMRIPEGLPNCGFKVDNETRAWENGKLLIFLDAHTHEAFNMSDKKRYILLFDIIRPEFKNKARIVCVNVLAMLTLYWLMNKYPSIIAPTQKWPLFFKNLALFPIKVAWFLYLPIQRTFNLAALKGE